MERRDRTDERNRRGESEEDYGTPAYLALSQGGFGFNREIVESARSPDPGRPLERRGPKGYARSDERIREDICERLIHDHHIDSSDVSIAVSSGIVTLEGTVADRWMKHAIEDIADHCRGVREVESRIRVVRATAVHRRR